MGQANSTRSVIAPTHHHADGLTMGQDSANAKPERPILQSTAPVTDSDTFTYDAVHQMRSATSTRYGNTVVTVPED